MSKKVLIISTSLRKNSNSDALAKSFAEGAHSAGNEVETISLTGKNIAFCKGCLACQSIGHCMTASPRGEADCSLRPGGEGGATRRMRASLTVRTHEIRRIGGMRHADLRRELKHTAVKFSPE